MAGRPAAGPGKPMGAAMAVALLVAAVQARNVEPGEYDEDDQDRETLW